jgi:hypothetical protein
MNMQHTIPKFKNKNQNGNVLFLILIAVILFAALSYAVTQSSRSGSGDAGRETNLVSSAAITQYPAAVKTSVLRMVINGTAYEDLKFNAPSDFAALVSGNTTAQGVFHPLGGGAVYASADPNSVESTYGRWWFNPKFEIMNIGTSTASSPNGNEFIAFLPGVKRAICTRINEQVGIGATIPVTTITLASVQDDFTDADSNTIPNESNIIGDSASSGASSIGLAGQPYGCFESATSDVFVYYQVLSER